MTALVGQLTVAAFSSCSKDEDNKNSKSTPAVYVAGSSFIWKDGEVLYRLDDTTEMLIYGSSAHSVFVSGSDVYAAGEGGEWDRDAILWKNGVVTELTGGISEGVLYVSGNDVYVAGTYHYPETVFWSPMVWKNGETTILSGDRLGQSYARSIFVVD